MSLATLNDIACTHARLQWPAWGRAWADVELSEAQALSGKATLKLADRSFAMTIVTGGVTESARARYRLVMGAGGWGKELPAKSYINDAGMRAATVIRDAATACGEQIGALPATVLGPHFVRAAGAASDVLNLLAPRAWYVDAAGVTQLGAFPQATYSGAGARLRSDPAAGVIELAVDELENLAPGVIVDERLPATDIEVELDASRLAVRVYAGTRANRRAAAMRRIFGALFPWMRYAGTYEFRVVTQSVERLNLQPVRVASGMTDLSRVPVRPGVPGIKAQVALGELVLVCFADCDPSRPQVIAHAAADAFGWMPLGLQIGEDPALGVARMTDPVQAGPFAGVITQASVRIKSSL